MSQDTRIVSSAALFTAAGLARIHVHHWWSTYADHREQVDAVVAAGVTVDDLRALLVRLADPEDDGGVWFGLEHSTGTGRTHWAVDPVTGAVTIDLHRPSAAWCRWSALRSGTASDSAEDTAWREGAAGPEPARGDRVVLYIRYAATTGECAVEVVEREAIGARHVDGLVDMLSRWGALLPAQRVGVALPEWQRDPARGLCVDISCDDGVETASLMRWGVYIAHVDLAAGRTAVRLEDEDVDISTAGEQLLAQWLDNRNGDGATLRAQIDAVNRAAWRRRDGEIRVTIPSGRERVGGKS